MKLGDAFTMAVPPRYDVPHLFFVISDPAKNGGIYHIVNLTTDYIRAGKECVLNVGDHEWITKTSYVTFRDAREIDTKLGMAIDSLVGNMVQMQRALRADILQKIIEAAKVSRSMPINFKNFL
jgi:hypothetical protein